MPCQINRHGTNLEDHYLRNNWKVSNIQTLKQKEYMLYTLQTLLITIRTKNQKHGEEQPREKHEHGRTL